jgi:uncharacterized protein YndB with AHSA1/START domain
MNESMKKIRFQFERTIPAPPGEVFDAWLNPKIPGNPWNAADKFLLNPKVDGFFYWTISGTPHYGRFTGGRATRSNSAYLGFTEHSRYESMVTVTFKKQGEDTLMTLVHSDLPDTDGGRGHEKGWNYFLGIFTEQFGNGSRKKK